MGCAYNVIDADGHILEPFDLWDEYMDPKFRDRAPQLVKGENGKERLVIEEQDGRRQPARLRRDRRGRRAAGRGRGRCHGLQGRQARRVRSARAHPRHGCRRHRRGVPLSEPRPVRRLDPGPATRRRDCAAPTTAGSPTTASPIPTACSASRCCRCSRSSWRSRRCASPARNSASAAASCGPTPTTTASCTTRVRAVLGTPPRSSISRSACMRAATAACRPSASTASTAAARSTSSRHTMEMMLAAMSMIWGGVCERHPEAAGRLPRIGRRLDRAVARPHGPPFRRPGLQRFRARRCGRARSSGATAGSRSSRSRAASGCSPTISARNKILWATDYPHRDGFFPGAPRHDARAAEGPVVRDPAQASWPAARWASTACN